MKVNCDFCGEETTARSGNDHNFCDRSCYTEWNSVEKVSVKCSWCGESFEKYPSGTEEMGDYSIDNHFCDKECESAYKSQEWTGKDHPTWDGGNETVTCEECGSEYSVKPSVVDKTRFCSRDCQTSNREVPDVVMDCEQCGDSVTRKPYNIKSDIIFCSDSCFSTWMRDYRSGNGNPQWNGGKVEYYGANWNHERQIALDAAGYTCRLCGMSRNEHYNMHGRDLDVHHRIPIDNFDTPEAANFHENLVVACRNCHQSKLERKPVPHNSIRAPKC